MHLVQKKLISICLLILLALVFCSFSFQKGNFKYFIKDGIHVIQIEKKYFIRNSDVYAAQDLETIESVFKKLKPVVVINAGFFDPVNKKTISYVTKASVGLLDPINNENLTKNDELKPFLNKILNRAELRVVENRTDFFMEIVNHAEAKTAVVRYAIQAGPALLPEVNLEKEFFIKKLNDKVVRCSANVLKKDARSAIGFNKDFVYLVLVQQNFGKTIEELAEFMKNIGAEEAMAFDGGSSASMCFRDKYNHKCINYRKEEPFRRVKSFLYVQ